MRLLLLLLLSGCSLFAQKKAPPAKQAPPAPPAWTSQERFYEQEGDTYRLYGVGRIKIPAVEKGDCPRPHLLANRGLGRARAQLASIVEGGGTAAPGREVSAAELLGSEPATGWYDGSGTMLVVAKLETSTAPEGLHKLQKLSPDGGIAAGEVVEAVKSAMLDRLDRDGICKDPHRRMKNKCCGGPAKFCSDETRFSRKIRADVCACGNANPCLYDFTCQASPEGKYRCICQGAKCPCSILNCKAGQQCGDGRCY